MSSSSVRKATLSADRAALGPFLPFVFSLWKLTRAVWRGIERVNERRALTLLDDRLLRDIGLTREQARREACKRFWET